MFMTLEEKIIDLSEKLLAYLLDYREKHPGFRFWLRTREHTRGNDRGRMAKGQWFQGSDYIFLSFHSASGYVHMTRSIGWVIEFDEKENPHTNITIVWPKENDPRKIHVYNEIIKDLGGFDRYHDAKFKKHLPAGDIFESLSHFLENTLPQINSIIEKNGLTTVFTIPEEKFIGRLNKITAYRNGEKKLRKPLKKTENMVPKSKNIILYGPPGTGKTYNSIDWAVEIITGKTDDHEHNKAFFDEYRLKGQIEFVTFHQNYGYEDFIVGIKPDIEYDKLRFKPYKGIFYELARRAKENYLAYKTSRGSQRSFDEVFNDIIRPVTEGKEVEIKMKSGIPYWINDVTSSSINFRKSGGDSKHSLSIDTLREVVDDMRTITSGLEAYYTPLVNLIKERKQKELGSKEDLKNFVLVIDEINRANISKVFGELITLLEDDKRLGEPNELKITLPNGEKDFAIPPNLYVVGTMNTADKSIALVDIALRRRFEFIGFYPDYDLEDLGAIEESLLRHINKGIYSKKKSADYLIGHAYFLNNLPIEVVLKNKAIPLLMEYFGGKTDVVSEIFKGSGWEVTYDEDSYSWEINTTADAIAF
jgi:hypothetical protein